MVEGQTKKFAYIDWDEEPAEIDDTDGLLAQAQAEVKNMPRRRRSVKDELLLQARYLCYPIETDDMYVIFRKIFASIDDHDTHLKKITEMSEDFGPFYFNTDINDEEEVKDACATIESIFNSTDDREITMVYDYVCSIKKLDAFYSIMRKVEEFHNPK